MNIISRKIYAEGECLQKVVDAINKERKILRLDGGNVIIDDIKDGDKVFVCPGCICEHNKINIWKVAHKLNSMGDFGTVCINGCRENCIKKDACLVITCTVGGICIKESRLSKERQEELLAVFDEERKRGYRNG